MFGESFGKIIRIEDGVNGSHLNPEAIREEVIKSKVVLMRTGHYTVDDFKQLSDAVGNGFLNYQGGAYLREKVGNNNTMLSVTGGTKMKTFIPMHGEMHYKKIKPSLLFFFCANPPVFKGETTICDAGRFFEELSDEAKTLFLSRKIKYIRTYSKEKWQQIFQTTDLYEISDFFDDNQLEWSLDQNDTLTTHYTCSAVLEQDNKQHFINNILPIAFQEYYNMKGSIVRLEDDNPIPEKILKEVWKKSVALQYKVSWQKGDVLMIDNDKVMHGRTRICDDQRNIIVRMSSLRSTL